MTRAREFGGGFQNAEARGSLVVFQANLTPATGLIKNSSRVDVYSGLPEVLTTDVLVRIQPVTAAQTCGIVMVPSAPSATNGEIKVNVVNILATTASPLVGNYQITLFRR